MKYSRGKHPNSRNGFKKGAKFSTEHIRKLSESHIGNPGYWTGKKRGPESEETKRKKSKALRGRFLGENNHRWRGGTTKLDKGIRNNSRYKEWRAKVFKRDNYTCVLCGIKNEVGLGTTIVLNVDHYPVSFIEIIDRAGIKSIEEALEHDKLWELNVGRTVCLPCHRSTETYGVKNHRSRLVQPSG